MRAALIFADAAEALESIYGPPISSFKNTFGENFAIFARRLAKTAFVCAAMFLVLLATHGISRIPAPEIDVSKLIGSVITVVTAVFAGTVAFVIFHFLANRAADAIYSRDRVHMNPAIAFHDATMLADYLQILRQIGQRPEYESQERPSDNVRDIQFSSVVRSALLTASSLYHYAL